MNREEEEKEKKVMKGSIYKFGIQSRQPRFQFWFCHLPAV